MPEEVYFGGASGGGGTFGVSTFGNTAGTTGTVNNGLVLVGGSNVTLSQSTGANGATITFNAGGTNITLVEWPVWPVGIGGGTQIYSGSTSANGASTHSTLSYYVNPYEILSPVKASRIDIAANTFNTSQAGTGSASQYNYVGLYKLSPASDSLTLVSSWFGGLLYSQNSVTAITISLFTGTNSASIVSMQGNISAHLTGAHLQAHQIGASSLISPDAYFQVIGRHVISAAVSVFDQRLGGALPVFSNDMGSSTTAAFASVPLVGAFSSTSSTNIANSNQWLMPPSVATNLITATRTVEMVNFYLRLRGV